MPDIHQAAHLIFSDLADLELEHMSQEADLDFTAQKFHSAANRLVGYCGGRLEFAIVVDGETMFVTLEIAGDCFA